MSDEGSSKPSAKDLLGEVPGEVDTKFEDEGTWYEHADPESIEDPGPNQIPDLYHKLVDGNGNGLRRVHVRSRYTKDFEKAERLIHRRAAKIKRSQRDEFIEKSRRKAMAQHCIVDWEFTDKQGSPIPCTSETAEAVMTDPSLRHHQTFVLLAIGKLTGDVDEGAEEDQGN